MGAKADGFRLQPVANDLFQTCERAAADEEDVRRIHLQEFLLRMLAAALWRNAGGGAFHQLQQSLLNTLTRHFAGNGGIFRLAAALVDLVDIDNATLRLFDIIVTGLHELPDNVSHLLTDLSRFRHRKSIDYGTSLYS